MEIPKFVAQNLKCFKRNKALAQNTGNNTFHYKKYTNVSNIFLTEKTWPVDV